MAEPAPPPSPTLTADFSIISRSDAVPPFRALFPRLWGSTRTWLSQDKSLHFPLDYTNLPPLDGEEGELIDDEACFINIRAATGFDILSRLPPELALDILSFLFNPNSSSPDHHLESFLSLLSCLSVSRAWRILASDNSVWKSAFLSRWSLNLQRPVSPSRPHTPSSPTSIPLLDRSHSPKLSGRQKKLPLLFHPTTSNHLPSDAPLSLDWRRLYSQRLQLERRWSGRSYDPVITHIEGHTDSVYCLEFDESSNLIITGSRDRSIKVWSLKTGRCLATFTGAHLGSVLCLKFEFQHSNPHSQNLFMVTGSSDTTICVWDLQLIPPTHRRSHRSITGHVQTTLRGHVGGVLDIRIDPKWIVSCSKDGVIRVWDRLTLHCIRTLIGHEGPVNAVGLQADTGRIVSASGDGKMILWDVESGERIRTFEGHDRGLACIEFKGNLIVSGSNDCKIKIWSITGECMGTLIGHEALVRAISFDPTTGLLVSASYDRSIKVWDIRTGKMLREFKNSHASHIFDVKFDCRRIVSTSHDQKLVVHDFSQGLDAATFFV